MPDLPPVFDALRQILVPYAPQLVPVRDDEQELYLDTAHVQKNKKPLFFGAVQLKKGFVSFHLMPVYLQPALLDGLSPGLKARMQGKSCFNFKALEPALLQELATLTQAGYASYQAQGYVP